MKEPTSNLRVVKTIALVLFIAITFPNLGCSRTVATVNGEGISRTEFNERLEQKAGRKILDELITEKLVLQEADKKNLKISEKEIDKKVDELKSRFPDEKSFDKNLEENNMTIDEVREQMKIQIITQKMLEKKIKVTTQEIKNYYEQNKQTVYKDKQFEQVKDQIKEQLEQQKLSQKRQTWLESLKKKAKIKNKLQS